MESKVDFIYVTVQQREVNWIKFPFLSLKVDAYKIVGKFLYRLFLKYQIYYNDVIVSPS